MMFIYGDISISRGMLSGTKLMFIYECSIFGHTIASDIDQVGLDRTQSVNSRGEAGISGDDRFVQDHLWRH